MPDHPAHHPIATWAPTWPDAADAGAAQRLIERFAAQSAPAAALAATPAGLAMLSAIGGGSPFLSDLAVREHACVASFMQTGPDTAIDAVMQALAAISPAAARGPVAAAMRRAKRQAALITALADIGGFWTLARVTEAITALAEATLNLAVDHLLLAAHAMGALRLPHPTNGSAAIHHDCGLIVLGMGKLGARELNYSSDIDLILLYDPDAHPDPDTLGAAFTRIARGLVAMMETRDADGYVFRTDLRLRPDPAATPPAVSLPAAIAYYESMGQNWERAAMTKARPVAGDIARGHAFLAAIRPFIWRRRLDFAAIADLHAMKRRIDGHRGFTPGVPATLAGQNIKLGPGGIREIEFAAQTLQLVWGGRDPGLRDPTTLGALRRLARAGHISHRAAAELTLAYRALRRVEHRLQMVADRQTHSIPDKPDDIGRFVTFLGCADSTAFAATLGVHTARVRARYAQVFDAVPESQSPVPAIDLNGPDLPDATAERLLGMGFQNIPGMAATLRGWQSGRLRALRSARARELMDAVLPLLLTALGAQADPDAAFARFDAMLSRLPAGVPLLSMVQRNPALLDRIAAVLGAAPSLADHLASVPAALEGLLAPAGVVPMPPAQLLTLQLQDATALEDVIAITRSLVRAEEFRLCVAQMQGAIDVDEAGRARSALADAALRALLPAVLAEQQRRYGTVQGGDIAVVELGKAGSAEMMAGSDLDLMMLYSYPDSVTESRGSARSLPPSQWFIRAAHAFVAALTAPGPEGPLYAVDMRLRPSGNKGPVAVPLSGFVRYHTENAWTWERMALTRARVVAGGPAICGRAERAIGAALALHAAPDTIRADAADMRRRLAKELPPRSRWDVKMRPGGGMEVEFIAQALQLVHGIQPGGQNTATALRGLATTGALSQDEAATLIQADLLWRTVQSIVRITAGRGAMDLPKQATATLLQAVGRLLGRHLDLPALDATLDDTARQVRAIFNHRIGATE